MDHFTRTQVVAIIGNLFSQEEIKDAKLRLPLRPENYKLWAMLNDAELGDYLEIDLPE